MGLGDLSDRGAVLTAIDEFDRLGRQPFLAKYRFGPARTYFLQHLGRRYDSKAIAGVAHGIEFPDRGRELPLLVDAGLTPLEAIQAATFNGPLTLGRQAPRSGQLADGYDADLIVVDADPLADITILADPARIAGVWKAGRRVKGPRSDWDLTVHSSSVGEPITAR